MSAGRESWEGVGHVDTSINGFKSQWCNKDKLCFIVSPFLIPPLTADAGRECVCYYFVDIQGECAGAWLVMAGYVCNVCADAGTQERRGDGRWEKKRGAQRERQLDINMSPASCS